MKRVNYLEKAGVFNPDWWHKFLPSMLECAVFMAQKIIYDFYL